MRTCTRCTGAVYVHGNRLTASNLTPVQKSSTSATDNHCYVVRHLRYNRQLKRLNFRTLPSRVRSY